MSEDRPMVKYGKTENTITINNDNMSEYNDRSGKLNLNGKMYYVNLKNKNNEGWIAGNVKPMNDEQAKKWLEGTSSELEKKTEVKDQDKKDDDLDDEIPF